MLVVVDGDAMADLLIGSDRSHVAVSMCGFGLFLVITALESVMPRTWFLSVFDLCDIKYRGP